MEDLYRTGQECPKTGNWLCLGNNKIEQINKGDVFGGYYEEIAKTESGVHRKQSPGDFRAQIDKEEWPRRQRGRDHQRLTDLEIRVYARVPDKRAVDAACRQAHYSQPDQQRVPLQNFLY